MDPVAQLNATIDALTTQVSTLQNAYQEARAQLANAIPADAVTAAQGKVQALLDSLAVPS